MLSSRATANWSFDRNGYSITFCGWTVVVGICLSIESGLNNQGLATASMLAALLVIILIVVVCVFSQGNYDRLVWAWKTGPFK